jgi:hypothetical protein
VGAGTDEGVGGAPGAIDGVVGGRGRPPQARTRKARKGASAETITRRENRAGAADVRGGVRFNPIGWWVSGDIGHYYGLNRRAWEDAF